MEEELKQLKSTLKSLVVSSPTTMDVRTLLRDYRNMVGGPLPLTKYGYRDPVQFLKERCGDCFLLQGMQSNPILTLIVSENLKHIDKFVQKQKVAAKHKGKRRSVPQTLINPPAMNDNLISRTFSKPSDTFNRNDTNLNQNKISLPKNDITLKNNNPLTRNDTPWTRNGSAEIKYDTPIRNDEPQVFSEPNAIKPNNINTESEKSHQDIANKTNDSENYNYNNTTYNGHDDDNDYADFNPESHAGSALSKFFKKRLPQYVSSENFPSSEADTYSKEDTDSGRQSSSSQSSASKQARLDELKREIFALIQESDDGVWCTDVMTLYREKYGRELKFNRYGHTSVISLIYSMEGRVTVTRPEPNGDWLLQDASRVVSEARAARRVPRAPRPPRAASSRDLPRDPEDALPGVDFEADVFPADCVHYVDAIPAQALADLGRGDMLEVIVGEVYSPSHFWMLRVGARHNLAMEDVMDEMTEYYSRGEGATRVLARGAIRVGQYCSSEYEHDWHRSLIVHVVDSDTVKVRHVDYGTVDTVNVSGLKPLLRRWAALPAQAVRARLAGCRPPGGGRRWARAACAAFLQRVRDRRLYANVAHVAREEDIVETFLVDTSGAADVCITRELIRADHADARPDSALGSGDAYLYPRFEALENGDTPNYAEIHRYLRDGIALEYVEAYRRHVPAALPPPEPARDDRSPPPPRVDCGPLLRVASPPAPSTAPAPARPDAPLLWPHHRPILPTSTAAQCQPPPSSMAPQNFRPDPPHSYTTQSQFNPESSFSSHDNLAPQFYPGTDGTPQYNSNQNSSSTTAQYNSAPVPTSTQHIPGSALSPAAPRFNPGTGVTSPYNSRSNSSSAPSQYNFTPVPNSQARYVPATQYNSASALSPTAPQFIPGTGPTLNSTPVQYNPGAALSVMPAQYNPRSALSPTAPQFHPGTGATSLHYNANPVPSATQAQYNSTPISTPAQYNPERIPSSTQVQYNPEPTLSPTAPEFNPRQAPNPATQHDSSSNSAPVQFSCRSVPTPTPIQFNHGPVSNPSTQFNSRPAPSPAPTQFNHGAVSSPAPTQFNHGPVSNPASTQFNSSPAPSPALTQFNHGPVSNPASAQFNQGPVSSPAPTQFNHGPVSNPSTQFNSRPALSPAPTQFNHGPVSSPAPTQFNHGPVSNPSTQFNHGPVSSPAPTQFNHGPVSNPSTQFNHGPVSNPSTQFNHGPISSPAPTQFNHGPVSNPASTQFNSGPAASPAPVRSPAPTQFNREPAPTISSPTSAPNYAPGQVDSVPAPSPVPAQLSSGLALDSVPGAGQGGDGTVQVRLTRAEWAVLHHLRGADPGAAHMYMVAAAWRALRPPPPGF